jgi:glycosyltransferase involved in cell wall biosynthesis
MRILMVTPYPPIRDGIASYAVQEVVALANAGNEVEVLSPWPSAAHHHLALRGPRGPLALAKRVANYDRVIIQYHPDIFYPLPLTDRTRLLVTAALVVAFGRKRNVEVRVHELNFDWGAEPGLFGRLFRLLWRLPAAITVHTAHDRTRLAASVGLPESRIEVMDHGRYFVRRARVDRTEARRRLGIDESAFMFLAMGFVQPHKGFDRAVHAFGDLADHGCRLDIVGSVRVDEPEFLDYASSLDRLVEGTRGVQLHLSYVSDQLFDVWLVAADVLLLPYRFIWSSGVLERAALYGTRVIATRVGGLDDQQRDNVELVAGDEELARAMRAAAGAPAEPPRVPWPEIAGDDPDRAEIQDAIRTRAAHLEPVGAHLDASLGSVRSPLERVALLGLPDPGSTNPVARAVKSAVRRLTAWEIDPIVHQLNTLQRAAAQSLPDRGADALGASPPPEGS